MATQIAAPFHAQVVSAEALQHIFSICDNVADDLRNGVQIRSVPISSVFSQGGQVVEVLKERLEAISNVRFEIFTNAVGGTTLFPVTESMSFGPSASSANLEVGTPVTAAVANTKKNADKTPRPKNAFMIYRLDFHATVAAQNPGMHNNVISKIIGAKWRSETPHIIEEYKRRAEEEKRQHAIAHPGYRYQPRKPSEKKKRMTKNKLARLAASSGSTNTSVNATQHFQHHNNVQNAPINMLTGQQPGHGINTAPVGLSAPMSQPSNGTDLDTAFEEALAAFNMSLSPYGFEASMMPQQDIGAMAASQLLPPSFDLPLGPAAAPFFEQQRQQELNSEFDLSQWVDTELMANVLGEESGYIAGDFDPVNGAQLLGSQN